MGNGDYYLVDCDLFILSNVRMIMLIDKESIRKKKIHEEQVVIK